MIHRVYDTYEFQDSRAAIPRAGSGLSQECPIVIAVEDKSGFLWAQIEDIGISYYFLEYLIKVFPGMCTSTGKGTNCI